MAWIKSYETGAGKRYRVYWKDPSGKQNGKVFKRSAEARAFKAQLEHDLDRGAYSDPRRGRITLNELWADFIEAPPRPLAPKTREVYELHWRLYLQPSLGGRPIAALQPDEVRHFIAGLQAQGVGAATINSSHRLLRRLLSVAVADRRIPFNPASGALGPEVAKREVRFLDIDEVEAIVGEVPDRYRALVHTLAYCGLRIGEAAALEVRGLDLVHGRIRIVQAASEVAGRRVVGPTKTRRNRSVSVPDFLRKELDTHLTRYVDFGQGPSALVFTTEKGSPLNQHAFLRLFQRAARRAAVDPLPTVHGLRHTTVALALKAGAHPKQIQELLGHSRISMTLDGYGHVFPALHDEVARRMDELRQAARHVPGAAPVTHLTSS